MPSKQFIKLFGSMKSLICFLVWISFQSCVESSAVLEWRLVRFVNSGGRDSSGKKCDVFNKCDHFFHFSIEADSKTVWTQKTGVYWDQNENNFSPGRFNNGVLNTIQVSFDKWPSTPVYLQAYVQDSDSDFSNPDDLVVSLSATLYASPDSEAKRSYLKLFTVTDEGKSLIYQYRVYCDDHFYGDECSKHCKSQDDNINGHFKCSNEGDVVCLIGWENEASMCLDKQDDCQTNKCQNGGICVDGSKSYSCVCKPGYTGLFCEIDINECASNPCLNNGACVDEKDDYKCLCEPEFVGKTCAEKACTSQSPCKNNGTCYGSLQCFCTESFYGKHCTEQLCRKTGCKNGGVCGIYGKCQCPDGVMGMACEIIKCDIMERSCMNGGKCLSGICQCPINFRGELCETSVVCENYPCENNGACENSYDVTAQKMTPSCKCLSGFSGKICQNTDIEVVVNTNKVERRIVLDSVKNCGREYFIAFITAIAFIFLLLLIVLVLAIILCKNRKRQFRKQPLQSILSTSPSVFSGEDFNHSVSQSTISSAFSGVTRGQNNTNERKLRAKSVTALSLGSVRNTALPNVYDQKENEEKLENTEECEYEALKDKFIVMKDDQEKNINV